jgi:putative FmdB family regulatory protein
MPVYSLTSAGCGGFELTRPMAQAATPAQCPTCGSEGRRVFSPPGLAVLARPVRRALDREEKSAHEPELASRKRGRPLPHAHGPTPPWVLSH